MSTGFVTPRCFLNRALGIGFTMGANVLVEFEKIFQLGAFFFKLGAFSFLSWGQKIILGSRKSAFLGIILTPGSN